MVYEGEDPQGKQEPDGIGFEKPSGEYAPPLEGIDSQEPMSGVGPGPGYTPPGAEDQLGVMGQGKVPLHPAMIRGPISILGRTLAELTKYPGFIFSEQEQNDIAEVWMQCGLMVGPYYQAAITTVSMVSLKTLAYFAWVRMGKPEMPGYSQYTPEAPNE